MHEVDLVLGVGDAGDSRVPGFQVDGLVQLQQGDVVGEVARADIAGVLQTESNLTCRLDKRTFSDTPARNFDQLLGGKQGYLYEIYN